MRYLLDANAISHVIRFPRGSVSERMEQVGLENIFTSLIVNAEIAFGVRKKGVPELAAKVESVMRRLLSLPWDVPANEHYAIIRAHLEKAGKPIVPNDLLIAAHALALDAILVTDNEKEFARVPGLKIENWLR